MIDEIESIDLFDPTFIQWCWSVKAELVSDLMERMREGRGETSARASLLLLYLGEPDGTDGIISCLQEPNSKFRISVLSSVSTLPLSTDGFRPQVPVKKQELFVALEPLLEAPEKRETSRQQRIHYLAVQIALKLNLPIANERLLPLLMSGSTRIRALLLSNLARRGEDQGALDTAEELLEVDAEIYSAIGALETYSKESDPVLALRSAEILLAFVRANTELPGNDVANHLWHALDGIVAAQHPE